jgi:AhpD family alkylhydroperoxidase
MEPRIEPRQGLFADAVAAGAKKSFGREMKSARVFAKHPRMMFGFMRFNRAAEHTPRVPKPLAELVVLRVATMVGCPFCIDIASEYSRRTGLTDEQLLSLGDARDSGLFDADQLMVVGQAARLPSPPRPGDDGLMERVKQRFGVKGTMELVQLIAWENHRSRQNIALGIGAEGFSDGKTCALPYAAAGIDSMSITNRNLTSLDSIRS